MPELTFRNAEEKDVPLILEFIKKLADYEHRLDEVIATEEALKYWIFDKNQAEVIFALEDGKEIGFAFFFLSFSTYIANVNMHLEDLFIDPEYRGKGYGKALLRELAKIVKERGYGARNSINPLVQKKRIGMFSILQENPWMILLMKINSFLF